MTTTTPAPPGPSDPERAEADLTPEEREELEAARQRAPEEERLSEAEMDLEAARRVRRFAAYAQAGGLTFLAVVSLGLLPTILAASYPAAGAQAAVLVWVVTPAIPIALLVVAALRLPR